MSDAPKRWTKLTAPKRACAEAPGLLRRSWASITRRRMCSTAVTAFGHAAHADQEVGQQFAEQELPLDARVHIAGRGRAGLERLLRDCARRPRALERLDLIDDQHVIYRLPAAQHGGSTVRSLTSLELPDHLAVQLVHRLVAIEVVPPSLSRRSGTQLALEPKNGS